MEPTRSKIILLSLHGELRGKVELAGKATLEQVLPNVLDLETHSLTQRPRYTVSGEGRTRQVEASSPLEDIARQFEGLATEELVLHLGEQARGGGLENARTAGSPS